VLAFAYPAASEAGSSELEFSHLLHLIVEFAYSYTCSGQVIFNLPIGLNCPDTSKSMAPGHAIIFLKYRRLHLRNDTYHSQE